MKRIDTDYNVMRLLLRATVFYDFSNPSLICMWSTHPIFHIINANFLIGSLSSSFYFYLFFSFSRILSFKYLSLFFLL